MPRGISRNTDIICRTVGHKHLRPVREDKWKKCENEDNVKSLRIANNQTGTNQHSYMRYFRHIRNPLDISGLHIPSMYMPFSDARKRLFRHAEKPVWECGTACMRTSNRLFRSMTKRLGEKKRDAVSMSKCKNRE